MSSKRWRIQALRALALLALTALSLQLVFVARVALAAWVDPSSTTLQRAEWRRLVGSGLDWRWKHDWVDYGRISVHLKRAVVASEDSGFVEHSGIEWDAIEQAWERNQRELARADRRQAAHPERPLRVRLVGGSTITQQLAKNLLLSGERSVARKAQEAVLALALEALLDKARILEIYLNHVEWGEGVFGAQAAAHHYFRIEADRLGPDAAARLAVMLPAPRRFEKRRGSAYLAGRASVIAARMSDVEVP